MVLAAVWLGLCLSEGSEPPRWVRLYGAAAPPEGPLILRVESDALERRPERANREPLKYFVRSHARAALRNPDELQLDEEGFGVISLSGTTLELPSILRVADSEAVLAEGPLSLPNRVRANFLVHHSGWFEGTVRGQATRQVRVGAMDGRLVRGRRTRLVVSLADSTPEPATSESAVASVAGVPLLLETQGLTVRGSSAALTDPSGRAYFEVVPEDLSASLTVTVGSKLTPHTEFFAELPTEQAGFWGSREGELLRVSSLIPLPRLYYALVTREGLLARGSVKLDCELKVPCDAPIRGLAVPQEPAWLVVGREPALDGKTAIGWPVSGFTVDPPDTTHLKESCVLDGKAQALKHYDERTSKRARSLLLGFAIVSLLFLGSVITRLRRGRLPERPLEDDEAGALVIPVRSERWQTSAVALLALSFVALGVWIAGRLYGR